MAVTLEKLLTHPKAFALVTATPVQRAICRIADGLPLGDLALDPAVVRMVGGPEALPMLPTTMPTEVFIVAAIRCGKSLLSAALATRTALACNLDDIPSHEVARVSVVSLDKDKASIVMEHILGACARDALRPKLINGDKVLTEFAASGKVPESIRLRRDDHRIVEIVVAAGKRAGGSLVSRWTVAVVFDEAGRMQGEDDGVINFEQSRKAVVARIAMRKGAQLIAVTSPWAPRGPIYEAVQKHWGSPTSALVLVRATGPEMCPVNWPPEAVEKVRLQDEGAYRTDVLGEFADPVSALYTEAQVTRCMRDDEVAKYDPALDYGAAMDPGTRSNAWTLVIVGRRRGETASTDRFVVARARQWQGSKLEPLSAKRVFADMAVELKPYGIRRVWTDQWGFDPFRELAADAEIDLVLDERTSAEKAKGYESLRTRIVATNAAGEPDPMIELPPDPVVRQDLLLIRKRLTPNGVAYDLPLTGDGRHCDYAPAINTGCEVAAVGAPDWIRAMEAARDRGGIRTFFDPKPRGLEDDDPNKPKLCPTHKQFFRGASCRLCGGAVGSAA